MATVPSRDRFQAQPIWEMSDWEICWGQFKSPLATLVGWHRRDECNPILRTQAAYDVAYWKLWHKLHD